MTTITAGNNRKNRTLELTIAGWFLLVVAAWELIFNRLATSLGVYQNTGAEGPMGWLGTSGYMSMVATGLMAIVMYWFTFAALINSPRFTGVWWRALIILVSPIYQLVIMWSVVERNIYPWLLLIAYLGVVFTAIFVTLLAVFRRVAPGRRRTALALALMVGLQTFAWLVLSFMEKDRFSDLGEVAFRAYMFAEVLVVVLPIIAFFTFFADSFRKLGKFIRRPHIPALVFALSVTALGIAVVIRTGMDESWIAHCGYLTLGLICIIPGGAPVYLVSLFFGALLVGCLILPSSTWKRTDDGRRIGMGLAMIWMSGLQPTKVYLFALMLVGFILLVRGMSAEEERVPAGALSRESLKNLMDELEGEQSQRRTR